RLGAEVRLVARVGYDQLAEEATAGLDAAGVSLEHVRMSDGPTGVALIIVDARGENQIVVAPGANLQLGPADVDVAGDDAVLCQLEIPLEAVEAAAAGSNGFFCLNAAPARAVPRALLDL